MVDGHCLCVLAGEVASQSRDLLAWGTMTVLANRTTPIFVWQCHYMGGNENFPFGLQKYATAVVSSVITLMWSWVTSLQRDCKPKRMAFSSK